MMWIVPLRLVFQRGCVVNRPFVPWEELNQSVCQPPVKATENKPGSPSLLLPTAPTFEPRPIKPLPSRAGNSTLLRKSTSDEELECTSSLWSIGPKATPPPTSSPITKSSSNPNDPHLFVNERRHQLLEAIMTLEEDVWSSGVMSLQRFFTLYSLILL